MSIVNDVTKSSKSNVVLVDLWTNFVSNYLEWGSQRLSFRSHLGS